jgi:hypothetical protein
MLTRSNLDIQPELGSQVPRIADRALLGPLVRIPT